MSTRRRRPVLTLVLLVVLVAVVGAGELAARHLVTDRMATALEGRIGERPTVTLDGGSALVSLATDHWTGFHVVAPDAEITARGKQVTAAVDADARDLTGLVRGSRVTAGSLSGHAVATWDSLGKATDSTIKPTSDGGVEVNKDFEVLGQTLPLVVDGTVALSADGQHIGLVDASLKDNDALAQAFETYVAPGLRTQIGLPTVDGLRFSGVKATQEGLDVDFTGDHVSVARP